MSQQSQDQQSPVTTGPDYCRTRTVLRTVLLSLWLSLCLSLLQAPGLNSLWQSFTATSLFLLWSSLLLILLLCLSQPQLRQMAAWPRWGWELLLALLVVGLNSGLALWLVPDFFPNLHGWFVLRNLLLTLLLMPWLLRHPWLAGDQNVPLLDEDTVLRQQDTAIPELDDALLIKAHGNLLRINLSEVRYFYADNKYVTARGPEQEYIVDQSLKQLEERFGEHVFRVHRGYLVVTAYIRGMQSDALGRTEVLMQDLDERVPVSRRYAPALRQFLKRLVGE